MPDAASAILGLHHATAVAAEAAPCDRFYTRTLGLARIKKTVNFDRPEDHHLYFADPAATPGSVMTCFTDADAGPHHAGPGGVDRIVFAVPPGSLDAWEKRLGDAGASPRPDGPVLAFEDPAGIPLGLVERPHAGGAAGALDGRLDHARLSVEDPDATRRFFEEELGVACGAGGVLRVHADASGRTRGQRRLACGGVDHVALRVADDAALGDVRDRVEALGLEPTPVKDRRYFHSVYFREPGGTRIEVATTGPGFAVDEPADALGRDLMLPPFLEDRRVEIVARLADLP
ncbi:VOC family protein [Phycisphaera mikurensis]|uniref:VOC domain-containing protein n=1 Tax=Phycisphaera mikurensis (strain NBRC 102666 / KCTC 22515 / FYK2301M01) TaxID=1142394 RepID=I0II55_PHYMF|nr:VOC family protein [Phycisphaera mikurensis]MBB6442494.1 glyoxalase family protein [Phycisphaera mikurensis]BAM04943.1 hypothetical protein PSMK_27840 [Phycisphaera mikurensis NBRC 102666]